MSVAEADVLLAPQVQSLRQKLETSFPLWTTYGGSLNEMLSTRHLGSSITVVCMKEGVAVGKDLGKCLIDLSGLEARYKIPRNCQMKSRGWRRKVYDENLQMDKLDLGATKGRSQRRGKNVLS